MPVGPTRTTDFEKVSVSAENSMAPRYAVIISRKVFSAKDA
jgi:hypothetical protein